MQHSGPIDQVKADILSIFKGISESEKSTREKYLAKRQLKARRTIEELQEQKRLREEVSDGWDLELH